MTGNWGGRREALAQHGIALGARYAAGFWSNVRGGRKTGTRYDGFAEWSLEADLEALSGWKGGYFELNWYSYHGGQPSEDLVGAFLTQDVSGHEAARSVRFFEIYLQRSWWENRLTVKAGQLAADSDFFVSENAGWLLNGTFGFLGIGRSTEIAPFYPLAAPGAYVRAQTTDQRWAAHFGVYTADTGDDKTGNIGFDYGFNNGVFLLGELRARRSPFGRTGSYALGFAATTAKLEDFERSGDAKGSYGLFASVDQVLIEATSERPGLGAFVRSYGLPQEDRTLAFWYVDFGLRMTRPFRSRRDDVLGLGFAQLRLSGDYVQSVRASGEKLAQTGSVLELGYRFQVTGWLTLQPDLQFFFDPNFSRRDATVIGLRSAIEL